MAEVTQLLDGLRSIKEPAAPVLAVQPEVVAPSKQESELETLRERWEQKKYALMTSKQSLSSLNGLLNSRDLAIRQKAWAMLVTAEGKQDGRPAGRAQINIVNHVERPKR